MSCPLASWDNDPSESGGLRSTHTLTAIRFTERLEGELGFPWHVGILLAMTFVQHFNDAVAGHIEILLRCGAVREVIACKRVHEDVVNTVPKIWHFMPPRFPNSGWKRFACWVAPCNVQVAHDVWTQRDVGVLPPDEGSNCTCAASAARICRETFD